MVEAQAYNAVHYTALPSCKQSCCCSCNRLVGPYKKEALIRTAPLSTDSETHTHMNMAVIRLRGLLKYGHVACWDRTVRCIWSTNHCGSSSSTHALFLSCVLWPRPHELPIITAQDKSPHHLCVEILHLTITVCRPLPHILYQQHKSMLPFLDRLLQLYIFLLDPPTNCCH